jgi:CRISPR-associated exonuclease Cas4
LPVSALADFVFCERRAALHHLEALWENNVFTVEGTHLHQKVDASVRVESRGDVRIARGLRLRSFRLGLAGIADVVEFHRVDGSAVSPGTPPRTGLRASVPLPDVPGLWMPLPVEYKRGRLRREEGYEVQLCAQALCLEEMLKVEVPRGAVFYGQPRRRIEVELTAELRTATEVAAAGLHELSARGKTPPARYESKCDSCSLIHVCMPKAMSSRRSARRYLEDALLDVLEENGEGSTP